MAAYLRSVLSAAAAAPAGGGRGTSPASTFRPSPADVGEYQGRYTSDEGGNGVFAVPSLGTVTFRRSPDGRVNELSVKLDRVWDLRFPRQP
jgi:hypothetical protein